MRTAMIPSSSTSSSSISNFEMASLAGNTVANNGTNNGNNISMVIDDSIGCSHNNGVIDDDSDYVVDIYMKSMDTVTDGNNENYQKITELNELNKLNEQNKEKQQNQQHQLNNHTMFAPIVQVEGLHISENGNVELVFQYDSDWSDLADDEDPDSNDERFFGNDYPEGVY